MDRLGNFNSPFDTNHFNRAFSGYLLEEGTSLYNIMYLYWQTMEQVSAYWNDEFIAKIDIKTLLGDYLSWISADGTRTANYLNVNYDHAQDENYPQYHLIMMLASYAGIKREHEVGALSLAHMLRLAAFHFGQRLFDGSRERLLTIYEAIEQPGMKFSFQTRTGDENLVSTSSAECNYTLYTTYASTNIVLFNQTDRDLWYGGYYNLEILGIVYNYDILADDALIYDNANLKYDDSKKYDRGVS